MRKKVFVLSIIILLITVIIETLFIVTYLQKEPEPKSVKTMCSLVACSIENEKTDNDEVLTKGYSIFLNDTFGRYDLQWKNNISYKRVMLRNMSDDSLENVINDSIEDAMASWISGTILHADSANVEIYCHSLKYLSFVNELKYIGKKTDYIHDYITIDIQTGKRVMLDDILRVDEEFVEYIQNNDVIKETTNDFIYKSNLNMLKEYTEEELLNELKMCSKTQQEMIDEGYCSIEESIGPLLRRNSFFLKENQLVIVLGYSGGEHHFTYDLKDISEFLKVDKW